MKKYLYIFCTLTGAALMGCTDLDLIPEDTMAPENYFSSEEELRLWTNSYYGMLPGADDLNDICADDVIKNILDNEILGNRTPGTEKAWDWEDLRVINTYFQWCKNCDDVNARNHYDGFSHFMRAYFYFTKVQRYGDVPYYDEVIGSKDNELLYKPRDSRKYVMQKVMEDLDQAISMLPETKTPYEVNKWTALALKSRAALFEGTFRKYHNLGDWEEMLKQSAAASLELIQKGGFSLYKTGSTPYRDLFARLDAPAEEIILGRRYSTELSVLHNSQCNSMTGNQRVSFTKRFVDHYLMADGSRYTDKPGHEKNEFVAEVTGRDPRLSQTILTPGYVQKGTTKEMINTLSKYTLTGYQYIKYVMEPQYDQSNKSPMYFPLFRLAEVYLNYAEALNEWAPEQTDEILKYVNLVRERAGIPQYGTGKDSNGLDKIPAPADQTAMREAIRRERRVEFNCEYAIRFDDIRRWKQIDILRDFIEKKESQQQKGIVENTENSAGLVNGTIETNLGLFRAYMALYLQQHKFINDQLTLMVRTLDPNDNGLPLQLYCFSANKNWVSYESIQAEIFEHYAAIMPRFGLYPFQNPSGRDYINSALLTAGHNPDELWGIPWGTMKEKNTEVPSSAKPEVSATPPPKPIPPIPPK